MLEQCKGLRILLFPDQNLSACGEQIGIVGRRVEQICIDSVGLFEHIGLHVGIGEHVGDLAVLGLKLVQLLEGCRGLFVLALGRHQRPVLCIQGRVVRVAEQRGLDERLGILVFLFGQQDMSEAGDGWRRFRLDAEDAAIGLLGDQVEQPIKADTGPPEGI